MQALQIPALRSPAFRPKWLIAAVLPCWVLTCLVHVLKLYLKLGAFQSELQIQTWLSATLAIRVSEMIQFPRNGRSPSLNLLTWPFFQTENLSMNEMKWSEVKLLRLVWLFVTPWTVAYWAPPSMGFSRQEYWSGLPFSSRRDLSNPGIEPGPPALHADSLPTELWGIKNEMATHAMEENLKNHIHISLDWQWRYIPINQ